MLPCSSSCNRVFFLLYTLPTIDSSSLLFFKSTSDSWFPKHPFSSLSLHFHYKTISSIRGFPLFVLLRKWPAHSHHKPVFVFFITNLVFPLFLFTESELEMHENLIGPGFKKSSFLKTDRACFFGPNFL